MRWYLLHVKYEEIIAREQETLVNQKKRCALVGDLKLSLLLLFAVAVYFMIRHPHLMLYQIEAGLLLVAQVAAWIYHARLHKTIDHGNGIVKIHQRHLARIHGWWTVFDDTGEELADPAHPYGNDLDIVG